MEIKYSNGIFQFSLERMLCSMIPWVVTIGLQKHLPRISFPSDFPVTSLSCDRDLWQYLDLEFQQKRVTMLNYPYTWKEMSVSAIEKRKTLESFLYKNA